MSQIMGNMHVAREVKHAVRQATNTIYKGSDEALVCIENIVNSKIGQWVGPFETEGMDDTTKITYVRDDNNSPARPFNVTQ